MKRVIIFLLSNALAAEMFSQNIPEGYILQYQQDFSGKNPISDFRSDDFQSWTIGSANGNKYLGFNHHTGADSSIKLPLNICLVDNYIFGDFIIEVSLMQSGDSAGGDARILFGMKDSLKYYLVSISSTGEEQHNGIFVVEDAQPVRIPCTQNIYTGLKTGKWHKVRIERNIVDTSVRIYFNDMTAPYLETKDRTFIMGYIGFGFGSGKGGIDDIKIWSQTSIPEPANFLKKHNQKM